MDLRLALAAQIFDLNTRLVENCLRGVDDELANWRISDRTNSIAFLVLHLTDARHWLIGWLGCGSDNPFHELLKDAQGIDDIAEFPPLEQILAAWRDTAPLLRDCFEALSDEKLSETSDPSFPFEDDSILGGIAFLAQHESHHVGQMALLRKQYGLDAMSWH